MSGEYTVFLITKSRDYFKTFWRIQLGQSLLPAEELFLIKTLFNMLIAEFFLFSCYIKMY